MKCNVPIVALILALVSRESLGGDRLTTNDRRQAVEQKLAAPLEWPADDTAPVTLRRLVQHLRQHNKLQVRFDYATLSLALGEDLRGDAGAATPPPTTSPIGVTQPRSTSLAIPPSEPGAPHPVQTLLNLGDLQTAPTGTSPPSPSFTENRTPLPVAPPSAPVGPDGQVDLSGQTPPSAAGPSPQPVATASVNLVPTSPAADPLAALLDQPIPATAIAFDDATAEEALRQVIEFMIPVTSIEDSGIPIVTRALSLDLVVETNSVLITTRLRANGLKETRVYFVGDLDSESQALVASLTHAVRPWSWRTQTTEIAEQLVRSWPKTGLALPQFAVNSVTVDSGIAMAAGVSEQVVGGGPYGQPQANCQACSPAGTSPVLDEKSVAALGQLLVGGGVAMVQSVTALAEIVYHGDPPTASIERVGDAIIVTQSQGGHREIESLLEQLRQRSSKSEDQDQDQDQDQD